MKVSMIGHSSVLIEIGGSRILTDPYFGRWGNLVYSRPKPPSCKREDLTDVNLVLVSHNHFDHTDPAFFRLLPPTTPIVAPSLTAWVTKLKGGANVVGMTAWQDRTFDGIKITAVPAWHSTISLGFVIEFDGKIIYFAADTYYGRFMERIARELKPQVVLMPVSTFRIPPTMGEKGALSAARTLSPKVIIPIHLGIAPRSPLLRNSQTPKRFEERLRQAGVAASVVILNEGQSWLDTPSSVM
jgi:L-ascorbate metabolism protein UlaG (beta-lactamase superfamily)